MHNNVTKWEGDGKKQRDKRETQHWIHLHIFQSFIISSIPLEVGKVSNKSDCKILSDCIMN